MQTRRDRAFGDRQGLPEFIIRQSSEITQSEHLGLLRLQSIKGFGEVLPVRWIAEAGGLALRLTQAGMCPSRPQQIYAAVPKHGEPPAPKRLARIIERQALQPAKCRLLDRIFGVRSIP